MLSHGAEKCKENHMKQKLIIYRVTSKKVLFL
jgi:hypothetical protein